MRTLWCVLLFAGIAFPRTEFWAPAAPPLAHYSADVKWDPATSRLEGTETIRFRNDTSRPIGRVVIQWFGDALTVSAGGVKLKGAGMVDPGALFELPADLAPGAEIMLTVTFGASWKLDAKTNSAVSSYITPRLWWGSGTLDEYEVRLSAPEGYALGTSGRYDAAKRTYVAERARMFGAFLGKGHEMAEANAGGVQVRAIFVPQARPCAELLLKTAVDVINFYRERFGFYPQRSLTIAPGMDYPAGGYPPATALAVVHGQHRMSERPEAFWRWITAHEIGHMYWGDYVLAQGSDSLSWLMLGMGIRADQEYRRARGIRRSGELENNYGSGLLQGQDTTMDITREQRSAIRWDFNNIVEHGKSIAMLNALESVIGREAFDSAYRRCLREYGAKRLGWREFQRVAEMESGQNLDWFFESWVRSSGNVFYRVLSKDCASAPAGFDCAVRIQRAGEAAMPVTIAARFEDGTEQRVRTERLARIDEIHFLAKSPVREVAIDPDRAVIMVDAPATVRSLTRKIAGLPWDGAGALEVYRAPEWRKIEDPGARFRLALVLYGGRSYAESLDVMKTLDSDADRRFAVRVWEGLLLDLLGRRSEALAAYEDARKQPGEPTIRHDQWGMTLTKAWVEERLKTPFAR